MAKPLSFASFLLTKTGAETPEQELNTHKRKVGLIGESGVLDETPAHLEVHKAYQAAKAVRGANIDQIKKDLKQKHGKAADDYFSVKDAPHVHIHDSFIDDGDEIIEETEVLPLEEKSGSMQGQPADAASEKAHKSGKVSDHVKAYGAHRSEVRRTEKMLKTTPNDEFEQRLHVYHTAMAKKHRGVVEKSGLNLHSTTVSYTHKLGNGTRGEHKDFRAWGKTPEHAVKRVHKLLSKDSGYVIHSVKHNGLVESTESESPDQLSEAQANLSALAHAATTHANSFKVTSTAQMQAHEHAVAKHSKALLFHHNQAKMCLPHSNSHIEHTSAARAHAKAINDHYTTLGGLNK
jgi:hypothetical protein